MPLQVKLFASDDGGCGEYRMRVPSRAVNASGADVETMVVYGKENYSHQLDIIMAGHLGSDLRVLRVEHPGCDVAVFQRPMYKTLVECIPHLKAHGVAVVVEVDDLFHRIHPRNPAHLLTRADLSPESNILWLERAMSMADLIICSTPALAKYYGKYGPARVVRNYVPASTVRESVPERDDIVFGWSGKVHTHHDDLETLGTGLAQVMSAVPGSSFFTVGDHKTPEVLGVEGTVTDWVEMADLPTELDRISVGMVPLAMNDFNQAKSYLKGLEYAARGIPFVASPTGEYEYLAKHGAGDLARTQRKWVQTLTALANPDYRAERAEAALQTAKRLTIEEHADEWVMAWADAWALRKH